MYQTEAEKKRHLMMYTLHHYSLDNNWTYRRYSKMKERVDSSEFSTQQQLEDALKA